MAEEGLGILKVWFWGSRLRAEWAFRTLNFSSRVSDGWEKEPREQLKTPVLGLSFGGFRVQGFVEQDLGQEFRVCSGLSSKHHTIIPIV